MLPTAYAQFAPTLWPTILGPLLLVAAQLLSGYRRRAVPYPVWMGMGAGAVTLGEAVFSGSQDQPSWTYLTLGCWLITACMLGIDQVLGALEERRAARTLRARAQAGAVADKAKSN